MNKKLNVLILIVSLVTLFFICTGFQISADSTSGVYTYQIIQNKAIITQTDPSLSGNVVIPSELGGYPVVHLYNDSFRNNNNITSVVIPDTVTNVHMSAFWGCKNLKEVHFGSNVKFIGYSAFGYCSSLTEIRLPASLEEVSPRAFSDCTSLERVIADGSGLINREIFYNCTSLSEVVCAETCKVVGGFERCKGLERVILGDNVEIVYERAFLECTNLREVAFGSSVKEIGAIAFYGCTSLKEVDLGKKVETIPFQCFYGCTALEIVNARYVKIVSEEAFYGCTSLDSIMFSDSLSEIGDNAFCGCSLSSEVELGDNIYSIGNSAFERSNIKNIDLGIKLTTIGKRAFFGSDFESITIPYTVTYIGEEAFSHCSELTSVNMHCQTTFLRELTFSYCTSLEKVILPSGLTTLGGVVFYHCDSLKSVYIPNSFKTMWAGVFQFAPLTDLYYEGTEQNWAEVSIYPTDNDNIKKARMHFSYDSEFQYLELKKKPTKTFYFVGEKFEPSGLEVRVVSNNGSSYTVNEGFEYEGFDSDTAGMKTVLVSWNGYAVECTVWVIEDASEQFVDLNNEAWYMSGIDYCISKRYFNGVTITTFCPDASISREQFVMVLSNIEKVNLDEFKFNSGFSDVPADHWASSAITWAYLCGYTTGVSETMFGLGQEITREQMAALLYRYNGEKGGSENSIPSKYTDIDDVSVWAYAPMAWAIKNSIINGTSSTTLSPKMSATRAQAAKIFMNYDAMTDKGGNA